MTGVPHLGSARAEMDRDGVPTEADLVAELASQDRSERWLLARQITLVLTLLGLLLAHVLLG